MHTRILYVFVGIAPLILFITGFVMWRDRKRPTTNLATEAMPTAIRTTSPSPDGEAAPTKTLARMWKQATVAATTGKG